MANLITHSLSFNKESINEYFIKPLFVENDIRDVVDIRLNIKSGEKLDFVDNLEKITKAYAQGSSFTSSTGVTITQKTLTVSDMKAEVQQNGKAFLDQVKQAALKKGYSENDVSDTLFDEIVMSIFIDGLKADLQRQIWLGDTSKETMTSDIPTATADTDYNVYDGFWVKVIDAIDATTIDASQFVDMNSTTYLSTAAVKEVDTITLTGTSGTGNITINGTAYLATFDTSLTVTAANFVTSHAATILARHGGLVVTSSGAGVIVTAGVAGAPLTTSNNVNVSGDLAGNTADTTANVATGAIKTDGSLAVFKAMYAAMPSVLKKNRAMTKFMATSSVVDNYRDTLESGAHDSAQSKMVDGVNVLMYRGIEIVEMMDWDDRIDTDYGSVRPHRVLLTMPNNLVAGMDGASDDMDIEIFYDKLGQNNVWRSEYKLGCEYIHEKYIVASYA